MPKLKKYEVEVQRVSYSHFIQIEVEATSAKEAAQLAIDAAGNYLYDEDSADYEVDNIEEIKK